MDTGLIARDIDALTAPHTLLPRHAVAAAMAVSGLNGIVPDAGFALWQPLRRTVPLMWGDDALACHVEVLGVDSQRWYVNDAEVVAERRQGQWIIAGQAAPDVHVASDVATVFECYGISLRIVDPLDVNATATGDGNVVEAPMPGLVKAVFAAPGATVSKGDRLAILEAMKMEHVLLAARDGTVAEVLAREGDQVVAGAALVRLEEQP